MESVATMSANKLAEFSRRVRTFRTKNDVTQLWLATELGVSTRTIMRIEGLQYGKDQNNLMPSPRVVDAFTVIEELYFNRARKHDSKKGPHGRRIRS